MRTPFALFDASVNSKAIFISNVVEQYYDIGTVVFFLTVIFVLLGMLGTA